MSDPVCVPFPAPGAPKRIKFIWTARDLRSLLDEPLVLTHDQLRLDLLHGVERNTDYDQDRRTAKVHVLRRYSGQGGGEQGDQHRDPTQEERAGKGDARHGAVQVLRRGHARPDAGDEGGVLLQVVRGVDRVEGDRGVEVGEAEDMDAVDE